MVAVTILRPVSITANVLERWFATYARRASGLKAILRGPPTTGMVAVMLLLRVSISDTLSESELVT
jgi:hypothetical protein